MMIFYIHMEQKIYEDLKKKNAEKLSESMKYHLKYGRQGHLKTLFYNECYIWIKQIREMDANQHFWLAEKKRLEITKNYSYKHFYYSF